VVPARAAQTHAPVGQPNVRPPRACRLCEFDGDLLLAAALRPRLVADYHQAEIELGHRFTHKLSMGEILAGLHATRLEARGARTAGDAKVDLWGMVRDHIAARAQAVLDKDVKPWSEQQINDRASAHAGKILDAPWISLRGPASSQRPSPGFRAA
jgi:hypothetical protein